MRPVPLKARGVFFMGLAMPKKLDYRERERRRARANALEKRNEVLKRELEKYKALYNEAISAPVEEEEEPQERLSLPTGQELLDILVPWAEKNLVIPHGELQGKPFQMADFQAEFLRNAFDPAKKEALLCLGRKNAKSALIAVLLVAILAGPLNVANFRATVVSLTGKLAAELRMLIEQFFSASPTLSEATGYKFNKTPAPGHIIGRNDARVDILSADRGSGHAVGADLAIIDELGLLGENLRELVDAAFSSLSARNGRLIALSIRGDGPHLQEMLDRAHVDHVYIQHHCLDEDDDPYEEKNWYKANPGLSCGIKSLDYMRAAAARASASPESESKFFGHDLNMRVDPARNLLCTSKDYESVLAGEAGLPPADGQPVIGVDLGGSTSMTAACALWPETGRCEFVGAFPSVPDLAERGRADHVGNLYQRLEQAGEIKIYPGRIVEPADFIDDIVHLWGEQGVDILIADRYSATRLKQTCESLRIPVAISIRRDTEHQNYDIESARELIGNKLVTLEKTGILELAIRDSRVVQANSGALSLEKATGTSRIDALSAFCHAAGGMLHALNKPKARFGWGIE